MLVVGTVSLELIVITVVSTVSTRSRKMRKSPFQRFKRVVNTVWSGPHQSSRRLFSS